MIIYYPYLLTFGGHERLILDLAEYYSNVHGTRLTLWTHELKLPVFRKSRDINCIVLGGSSYLGRIRALKERNRIESGHRILTFGIQGAFYLYLSGSSNYILHYTDPPSLLTQEKQKLNIIHLVRDLAVNIVISRSVSKAVKRIAMTRSSAAELSTLYNESFEVIYLGTNRNVDNRRHERRGLGSYSTPITIMSVCRLEKSKNIDWIIRSFCQKTLPDDIRGIDICINIIGEGSQRQELMDTAADYMRTNPYLKVNLKGYASDKLIRDLYKECDLVAVPAKQGYGLPILEAAVNGIPVVLSKESRVSEILGDDLFFIVTNHNQVAFMQGLFEAIRRLKSGLFPTIPSSKIPTREEWAYSICKAYMN